MSQLLSVYRCVLQKHYHAGLAQLSYEQHLKTLKTLSLEQSRNMADLVFVYKCLHHLCDINLQDVGILPSCNNERRGKLRLGQFRPLYQSASSFFKFRIPSKWNKLPDVVANAVTLNRFKYAVKKSLFLRCRFRLCEEITRVFNHTCANVIFSLQYFRHFNLLVIKLLLCLLAYILYTQGFLTSHVGHLSVSPKE